MLSFSAVAAPPALEAVAKVQIVKGQLQRVSKIGDAEALKEGSLIYASDTVRTSQDGGSKIQLLKDGSVITLGPSTQIIASDMAKNSPNPSTLDVSYGRVRSQISKSNAGKIKLILKTRSATMGVRGTEFETSVNPQTGTTSNITFEGEVAMAKTPPAPPAISESQAKALNTTEKFAVQPTKFNPSQVAMVARAEASIEARLNPAQITPEIRQAMVDVKAMAASTPPTGIVLSERQAKAMAVLEKASRTLPPPAPGQAGSAGESVQQLRLAAQAAAPTANPPLVTADAGKAFGEMLSLTQKNLAGTPLPPAQVQAMQTLQALARRAEASGAPIKPTPTELAAFAQVQKAAVQSTIVSAAVPNPEVFKAIGDPDKTVSCSRGQYSGMNPAQEQPTIPVKISPSQMESMRTTSLLTPPSAATSNGQGAASAVPGKTISVVPPGLDAKAVTPSLDETKAQMAKSGVKPDATSSAPKTAGPPPEGMVDSKGRVAPPAGGFVDMKTGVYIPPPTGSAFDPVAGVYVPPPSMGTFNPNSGTYVPPAGFVLDAARGFVPAPKEDLARTAGGPATGPGGGPGAGGSSADKPFGDPGKASFDGPGGRGGPKPGGGLGDALREGKPIELASLGGDGSFRRPDSMSMDINIKGNPFDLRPVDKIVLDTTFSNAPGGKHDPKNLNDPKDLKNPNEPPKPPTIGACGDRPCDPPPVNNQCPPICTPKPPETATSAGTSAPATTGTTGITINIQ